MDRNQAKREPPFWIIVCVPANLMDKYYLCPCNLLILDYVFMMSICLMSKFLTLRKRKLVYR